MKEASQPSRRRRHGPDNSRAPARIISFGNGRFRPRARLIRTIGAELISSEVVAVLELVRNSYDADATRVEIRFTDPHIPGHALIEINDDGHGMSREVLLGPWLEPATDHKASEGAGPALGGNRSPGGRRRLGSKGVGRFAAQRLGHKLVVRTSTGGRNRLEADFDWVHLDRPDRYLDQLRIPWREIRSPDRGWHGTSLTITELRDNWTSARFERLRLGLMRLLGPGLGSTPFDIKLIVNGIPEDIRPAIDLLTPMYSIEGSVEAPGTATITYKDLLRTEEHWTRRVLWPVTKTASGTFKFKINAWDLDREAFQVFLDRTESRMGPRSFRRIIRDHSGISLYRDGFRILPYGEPDNDWLRLDRRRVNNPTLRLSNNQILGWIQITADGNPLLQDQTNREGLVANEAYAHLQHVVVELLGYLETRRFTARRSPDFTSSRTKSLLPPIVTSEADSRLEDLLKRFERRDSVRAADVEALRIALHAQREQASTSVRRYSALAATGQLASLLFSRIAQPLRQIESEASILEGDITRLPLGADDRADLLASVARIKRRSEDLKRAFQSLDPVARPRQVRRLVEIDLKACLDDVIAVFSEESAQAEVDVQTLGGPSGPVLGDLCVAEQVFAILMQNALQWVREGPAPRVIKLLLGSRGFVLENSGPVIPKEQLESIFEPHFTTREDASGMGLTLARDLMAGIGGAICALPRLKGAAFEVIFPMRSDTSAKGNKGRSDGPGRDGN